MFKFGKNKKKDDDFMKQPNFGEQPMNPRNVPSPKMQNQQMSNAPNPGTPMNPPSPDDFGEDNIPSPDMFSSQNQPKKPTIPKKSPAPTKEEVEEISESVVSEKTEEIIKKLDDLKGWQKKVISKLELQEKEIGYLRGGLNGFRENLVNRLTECEKGIKEIRIEIKVMEKIFSEIMPTFVKKIKDLSEITDDLKESTAGIIKKKTSKKK